MIKGSSKIITALSPMSASSQSSHIETEEPNDSNSTTSSIPNITHTLSKTTSNWRLKGKRNSRSRKTQVIDETETRARKSRSITEIHIAEFSGWSMNPHRKEKQAAADLSQRLLPYRHSRFTVNPKYESSDFPTRHHVNGSGLYEVKIEVKSTRRPQGVPYISLMSKLSGRPVTGNPVEIEVLENGFCDSLLNAPQCSSSSSEFGYNGDKVYRERGTRAQPPVTPVPLMTKRGTLRKNNYPQFRKSAKTGMLTKKTKSGLLTKKAKIGLLTKKAIAGLLTEKEKTGLLTKKEKTGLLTKKAKNGLLTKKMRKFSSLSHLTANGEEEEETKLITEKVNPVITCVPLKVVFSRINADLSNSMRCPALCLSSVGGVGRLVQKS